MVTDLYNGRPNDTSGRLDKEIRVYDLLDELGIEYCRIDHTPAGKMEACGEIDKKFVFVQSPKNKVLSAYDAGG